MAKAIRMAPFAEPKPVPCRFLEGIDIEVRADIIRLVGFDMLETVEGNEPERRIVLRGAMTLTTARELIRDLSHVLARGGN